ncbi:MAG: CHRD domain-containing protein [Dehalococcoidia bacterium]|nr:CHRD domain-containing protein [Dehalococcoidia bacterium]
MHIARVHKRATLAVAAVAALALAAFLVLGADWTASAGRGPQPNNQFVATLTGLQEVPAISTPARGRFVATVDGDRIHFRLTYNRLQGAEALFAHIHFGQRAVNGGVIVHLCGGPRPACPHPFGTVEGTIRRGDIEGPASQGIAPGEFDEVVRAMRSRVTYVNVHTDLFPSGEIRGQLIPR